MTSIGSLWASLSDVSGFSGGLLGTSWGPLGIPESLLGVPGRPLGGFVGLWVPFVVLLGVSLGHHFPHQIRIILVISQPRRLSGQIPSFGR